MGRASGFVIRWPVAFSVEDGRTFTVRHRADPDDMLLLAVSDRAGELEMEARRGDKTEGAIIGRTLRWWRETTGVPVFIAPDDAMAP